MTTEILCPWFEFTNDDGVNRIPLIQQFFEDNNITDWRITDTTDQPATEIDAGDLVVVHVTCSQATLDLIAADNRFLVLWSEP